MSVCDCACGVAQTMQAKLLCVCVYLFMVDMACNRTYFSYRFLILLAACITGQQCSHVHKSRFFLCCHYMSSLCSVLLVAARLTSGKSQIPNELATCHGCSF